MSNTLDQPWHNIVDVGIDARLLDHNGPDCDVFTYPCRVCGREVDIDFDLELFDADWIYCGGSPMCCP